MIGVATTKMNYSHILEFLEKLYLHTLTTLLFFFSLFLMYKWLKNHKGSKTQPPSPPKLPVLGNLHQFGKDPHRFIQSLPQKYGDLVLLYLGSKPTLVASSANAAKEILKTNDVIFSNRPLMKMQRIFFYNGKDVAFSNYGENWRLMKSICVSHLLSKKRVRSFGTIREEETSLMVEKIIGSETKAVNLSELIGIQANDVICRAAFGRKYRGKDGKNFALLIAKFLELLGVVCVGDAIPCMGWVDKLNGLESKAKKVAKELDMLLEGILEEHLDRRSIRQGNNGDGVEGHEMKDFMDVLIDVMEDETIGLTIDRESIKSLILDMFEAGTDTLFTLLEWAMSELIRHPRAMNKLQEEVRRITQGKPIVNEDELENMEYLKAVIKETLRLHPPAPLLVSRESTKEVKINGYDIEAKSIVIINAWKIQRDPSTWDKPEEFYPERFMTSSVDFKGQDFELIPFGAGRRMCPGERFATINAELVLATLVGAFDWALPGGAKAETLDMEESIGFTSHRRNPLLVVATPHYSK